MISLEIPGRELVVLERVVFDVNGTLTNRGALVAGVAERVHLLRQQVDVLLASADTYGTLEEVAKTLDVPAKHTASDEEKRSLIETLVASHTAHIGNGSNDASALRAAALGIAILGPEGTSPAALAAADLVCLSACDAIDLLLDTTAIAATLRS